MQLSIEFVFLIITQVLTAGIFIGGLVMSVKSIEKQITRLEEKQDKHNSLIERMCVVEQSCKSAHHRLDEISQGLVNRRNAEAELFNRK